MSGAASRVWNVALSHIQIFSTKNICPSLISNTFTNLYLLRCKNCSFVHEHDKVIFHGYSGVILGEICV